MDPFSKDKQQENQQLLAKQTPNIQNTGKIEKHSFRTSKMRFVFLVFGSLVLFGNYYCEDNVEELWHNLNGLPRGGKTVLNNITYQDGTSDSLITWFYSVCSYPNILIPLFSGLIVDKVGPRIVLVVTTILLICGQVVFLIGCYINVYPVMIIGRILYGFGEESQQVAQKTIVTFWFHGKELAMALAGSTTAGNLGSTLSTQLTPRLFQWTNSSSGMVFVNGKQMNATNPHNFLVPLLMGAIIICVTLSFVFIVNWMDKKADQQEGISFEQKLAQSTYGNLLDIFRMKPVYYLIVLNSFFANGAFLTMNVALQQVLSLMFGLTTTRAGFIIMLVYFIGACCAPLTGRMFDKIGKQAVFILVSMIIFAVAVIILMLLPQDYQNVNDSKATGLAMIPLFLFSVFYCLHDSALEPCIRLSCKPQQLGIAYGLVELAKEVAIAIMFTVWGQIQDSTQKAHGVTICLIYLLALIACGIVTAVILNILDAKGDKNLNKPSKADAEVSEAKKSFHV